MENINLKKAISEIEKKFGRGAVIPLTGEVDRSVKKISSGLLSLDLALGGGYPRGRIIEIYGPESSGKSTVLLEALAIAQKSGKAVAYIDTEHSFDPIYGENLGLDLSAEKFIFSQPSTGEEAFGIVEELLKSEAVVFIGVDSVAALIPRAELEGEMGESKMGLHARLMSQAMRKLAGLISKTDCIVFFTNQLRDKIGVIYGPTETTTGGNALKFYASIRMDIRRRSIEKDGDGTAISNVVKIKVVKNKVAPPFKETELTIEYGTGFDKAADLLSLAVDKDIIKKAGSWYSYGATKLGQGKDSVIALIKEDYDLQEALLKEVKKQYYLD